MNDQKGIAPFILIIIIAAIALAAGGGYYFVKQSQSPTTISSTDIAGWKTYKNASYGYEISLPADWQKLSSHDFSFVFKKVEGLTKIENIITVGVSEYDPTSQNFIDDLRREKKLKGPSGNEIKLISINGLDAFERQPTSKECLKSVIEFSILASQYEGYVTGIRLGDEAFDTPQEYHDLVTKIAKTFKIIGDSKVTPPSYASGFSYKPFTALCNYSLGEE